mgnify:CR=1 FL=1
MKHAKRRIKVGETLMDVAKYLLTIGFIGGIFTEKINVISGIVIILSVVIIGVVAFFIIPPEKED